jgi:hypothetical protein
MVTAISWPSVVVCSFLMFGETVWAVGASLVAASTSLGRSVPGGLIYPVTVSIAILIQLGTESLPR